MSIDEAIQVIRNPESAFNDCVEAAGLLADTPETPLMYLVECLKRGGLPAELAAMKLYLRTGRPRWDASVEGVILNHDDWLNYINRQQESSS